MNCKHDEVTGMMMMFMLGGGAAILKELWSCGNNALCPFHVALRYYDDNQHRSSLQQDTSSTAKLANHPL